MADDEVESRKGANGMNGRAMLGGKEKKARRGTKMAGTIPLTMIAVRRRLVE